MKRLLLFAFLLHLLNVARAQNFVPDSSFEENTSCTFKITTTLPLPLKQWFIPTSGSSDYFNACDTNWHGSVWVPSNAGGYQATSTGDGYVGLYVSGVFNQREYVSCKLTGCGSNDCPLTPGDFYKFSMKVSLAEKASNSGSDGLGAYLFTDTLPTLYKALGSQLPFIPKIDFRSYGIITDTTNWVTLVDTFQADSAYRYLVIGGVRDDQNTNFTQIRDFWNTAKSTYFYIDDVRLEPLIPLSVASVKQPTVTIYPNPVIDKSTISISGRSKTLYTFMLINMLGQTVQERINILDETIVFERENLPSGVYYYQIKSNNEIINKGKFVLQ